ncbi:hypothetical protein [Thioflexithrix psekupsensis]|uniref:Uncharacterized protein n=1 Tax=Thioflexithrix psekupsensis TaxID=1570016 RepID=A0A251X9W9_9GAMM|nr:hypothetical protein [Thioflexithrix psekupsensis]OUD15231.1 hypothetical protein TPSD3_01490 [Thioflexithrix psekupsensis]
MNFTLKITFTIFILLSLSLAMISLLNYFKYDKTLADLVRSRSDVVAMDIKNNIESNLSLGLFLSEISNLKDILDRAKEQNDHILKIYIFGQDGVVLSSTDENYKGQAMLAARLRMVSDNTGGKVAKCNENARSQTVDACLNLENSFSQQIGGIYLESSKDYHQDKIATMFKHLLSSFILVLSIITILTAFWIFNVFRETAHSFKRMNQQLMSLIKTDAPISESKETDRYSRIKQNDLEHHCDDFYQKAKDAFDEIKQFELTHSITDYPVTEEKPDVFK